MIHSLLSRASRLAVTFITTFAVCYVVFTLSYRHPNIPIILIECIIYGILMAICRIFDKQPSLNVTDVKRFIIATVLLWVIAGYLFVIELPIRSSYALFWAFAYSNLISGFQLFVGRSLFKSKYKLLLSPFIVGGLSLIPIILAGISYAFDLSAKGHDMNVGISKLWIFLPPAIAIWSATIIYFESLPSKEND